jgi:carotenoid cleavage dioxygenase
VNTNVVSIGGRSFALVEAGSYPVELGEMLDAQRYNPFDGTLKGSFSAHPHLGRAPARTMRSATKAAIPAPSAMWWWTARVRWCARSPSPCGTGP